MEQRLERLRLGVALAHAVPKARLILGGGNGVDIRVASDSGADLSLCDLRRVVLAAAFPVQSGLVNWIETLTIEGSLDDRGGGLYGRQVGGKEERWFSTLLRRDAIFDLLDRIEFIDVPDNSLHAAIEPDFDLGVSSVCITTNSDALNWRIDELAGAARTACVVEELTIGTSNLRRSP